MLDDEDDEENDEVVEDEDVVEEFVDSSFLSLENIPPNSPEPDSFELSLSEEVIDSEEDLP